MDFRILGPVEIAIGSERLELGGARQQIVVAALLLSANKVVTMDRLLDALYGEDLPPTARAQVQISISSLRRTFASCSSEPVIDTHGQGYVIKVESGRLDSERFEELVAAARAAREANSTDLAVARYRDALRLWRGPALDGIDSVLLRAAAHGLDEQRIATNEERITAELELGRHHELVGELGDLVRQFPLRERLRGQLMLALYRSDRAGEATKVYEQARNAMVDELGIEPGEYLQHLARAISITDPALDLRSQSVAVAPVGLPAPGMLPTDIADFTGRAEHISQIREYLAGPGAGKPGGAVPIVVITGKGGIGKTSLAVRVSHDIADHFPDGQLFADLHGAGASQPVGPMQVLERFLRALGIPGTQMPEGLDERAEVYRSLLADRKMLVVLDDAASESQVSPLLPGNPDSAVMITSRSRLAGLAGAVTIDVNVFDIGKSLELLARIVGTERIEAEPIAAAEVAGQCGYLPLALRIAGARLVARSHWQIQQLAERLADETRRLDELRHGEMGIRPSISLTYDGTSERARRLFRCLALLDLPLFSGWLSSVLIDEPLAAAEDLLDDLVSAQLVEIGGNASAGHSQYRFHDLIRVFARERLAAEDSPAERMAALERVLGALLYVADRADREHFGGEYFQIRSDATRWQLPERLVQRLVADPLAWYERERATLVWGVRQAAQAGFTELSWSLAYRAVTLFDTRSYLDDWRETHEIALEAARKGGNVRGQAAMRFSFGAMHIMQQRFGPAHEELTAAARLFQEVGDSLGVAFVIRFMADLDRSAGKLDDAARGYEQALAMLNERGDSISVACVLRDIAQIRLEYQRPDEAVELLSEALRLTRAAGCARIEAQVLHRLGEARLQSADLAGAVDAFEQALSISREVGDVRYEAYALRDAGVARVRLGEFRQARKALQRAVELSGGINERAAQTRALLGLSELALASGDPHEALLFGQQAVSAFREMCMPLYEADALRLLSDAYAALSDADAAESASAEAVALRAKVLGHYEDPLPGAASDPG
jgi:DNA-binding SARP family transcriptional activator/tetratricopeptide (TPR) repeat protein